MPVTAPPAPAVTIARRRRAAAAAIFAASVIVLTIIVLRLSGIQAPIRIGPLRVRVDDLVRPLLFVVVINLVLLVWRRRSRLWRRLALVMLAICGLLAAVDVARGAAPTWPIADAAVIEMYTIHALHGQQLLGPYSQFGWHHPGPAMFYLLVPFYLAGGPTMVSLNAGALAINLISIVAIAWVVWRNTQTTPVLTIALGCLMFLYLLRVHVVMASAWNPHIGILPLLALIIMCAALAAGDVRLLPASALFASFIGQAHIGLVPVTAAVVVAALVFLAACREPGRRPGSTDPGRRRSLAVWANLTAWLLVPVWVLPVAEELTQTPGNMTLVWRFFSGVGRTGQPVEAAFRAAADMLLGVFRPDFHPAWGWLVRPSPSVWPVALAVLETVALAAVGLWAWRAHRRFHAMLAALCGLASIVAFWSATRIFGEIVDHDVFWASALGSIGVAIILGAVASKGDRWLSVRFPTGEITAAMCVVFAVASIALGFGELRTLEQRSHTLDAEQTAVRALTRDVRIGLGQLRIQRPLFRLDGEAFGIGSGVVLQLQKARTSFAVTDYLISLFGRPFAASGDEDADLTICGEAMHRQLAARSNNFTVAQYESIFFVDGVRVIATTTR
jgi:hypothetical protein